MIILRLLLVMVLCLLAGCATTKPPLPTSEKSECELCSAQRLIQERRFEEARTYLEALVSRMPAGWKPVARSGGQVLFAYWDMEHFQACAAKDAEKNIRRNEILWVQPSYSKAYYYLAFISLESRRAAEANQYIDKALALEPDHPMLLLEKGTILQHLKANEEALKYFNSVALSSGCATNYEKARALRGQGVILIELGRLDEAERALNESLRLEPGSKVALNELGYIRRIRSGTAPKVPIELFPGRK